MADNSILYGFRWSESMNGHPCPKGVPMVVASGQAFTPDAATAARLQPGDPVARIAGGTIDHAAPGSAIWGIVVGVGHDGKVFNSTIGTNGVLHPSSFIPSGVVPPSSEEETIALVVPAGGVYWEVDSDQTLADQAAWQLVIGLNADHTFTAPGATDLNATPRLGATVAAPGTAQWRLDRLSARRENADFSGANVKLIVLLNEGQAPPYSTASI